MHKQLKNTARPAGVSNIQRAAVQKYSLLYGAQPQSLLSWGIKYREGNNMDFQKRIDGGI